MGAKEPIAFNPEVFMLPVEKLVPIRDVKPTEMKKPRYIRIEASIKEVGVIEPLMVFRQNGKDGPFVILDGNYRFSIVKAMGHKEVPCLFASRDDTYTYNARISEVTSIQEHYMIAKAIERGVSKERLAKTLHLGVNDITQKEKLLDGICSEAIELLKKTTAKPATIRVLANVKPIRQIEMVELMNIANNHTLPYARSLVAGTPRDMLVNPEKQKELKGLKPEELAVMEKEMEVIGKEIIAVDETYSRNVLNLVLATGYLKKLINNSSVLRFLTQKYSEFLGEFQKIIEATALDR